MPVASKPKLPSSGLAAGAGAGASATGAIIGAGSGRGVAQLARAVPAASNAINRTIISLPVIYACSQTRGRPRSARATACLRRHLCTVHQRHPTNDTIYPASATPTDMTSRPETIDGAASENSQESQRPTLAWVEASSWNAARSAWKPIRLPIPSAARMKKGVVAGLLRKVIAAATGMLARNGAESRAAPTTWTPGTIRKIPTNRPTATPRGTERRVKRHSSEWRMRSPNGFSQRLLSISSRVGACRPIKRRKKAEMLAMLAQQPALLALPVALFFRVPLVVHFLAPRDRQLDLGPAAAVKVNRQRDERQALAGHRALELGDFTAAEQQFPLAARLMIHAVAVAIFGDRAVDQPDLLAFDRGIAFGDRPLAAAQRLDLGAAQLDPGFEPFLDEIIVARAPVLGDDFGLVERGWKRLGHQASDEPRIDQSGVDRGTAGDRGRGQRQAQLGREARTDVA